MSISILYSPGYGSGWSSDNGGSEKEREFLLTYPGFIEALEKQERHDEADDQFAFDPPSSPSDYERKDLIEVIEASLAAEEAVKRLFPEYATTFRADFFRFVPYELLLAVPKFLEDWKEKFPGGYVSLWGLPRLEIAIVPDLSTLRIKNFDGSESIGYRPGIWE